MVYLSLIEEIKKVKTIVQQLGGLELSLYQYLKGAPQTQKISDFKYEDYKMAYAGYSKAEVERDTIEKIIIKKRFSKAY